MSRPVVANLLDDFALGGVSRGLGIFETDEVRAVASSVTVAVPGRALIAPALDADVIVVHFPPNWRRLAFFASLRLRNRRASIVHVEHSYTRGWEANKVPRRGRFRTMLGLGLRMVDQVVCVSQGQADWLAEAARLPREAIAVIYPYSHNPGLAQVAPSDYDGRRPLRIGAMGRFHEAKGFARLIEAFTAGAMSGCELVLGGFGPEEATLRQLAGDNPGIRFVGTVRDVAGFLAQVDVVAMPSRWEAFGQVANEAREAGRPILVSPVDGLPEQVGDAGLVVDFGADAAIADALATLSPQRLAAMAEAGRVATRGCAGQRARLWSRLIGRLNLKKTDRRQSGLPALRVPV